MQHDCYNAKCRASGKQAILQERAESGVTHDIIVHLPLERFVINTHALHNPHLIREVLPRYLVAPVLKRPDPGHRHQQAEKLRNSRDDEDLQSDADQADAQEPVVLPSEANVPLDIVPMPMTGISAVEGPPITSGDEIGGRSAKRQWR